MRYLLSNPVTVYLDRDRCTSLMWFVQLIHSFDVWLLTLSFELHSKFSHLYGIIPFNLLLIWQREPASFTIDWIKIDTWTKGISKSSWISIALSLNFWRTKSFPLIKNLFITFCQLQFTDRLSCSRRNAAEP